MSDFDDHESVALSGKESKLRVGPGTAVTMHFAIKLEDGEVVDSTFGQDPASFEVGDNNLLEGFESALFGLAAGEQRSLRIESDNAFGAHNPDNIQTLPRSSFSNSALGGDELAEGLMLSFADANQQEVPGVIQSVDEEHVVVDFNHPLAGRDLVFEVEILNVKPAIRH